MDTLIYILIFIAGLLVGYILKLYLVVKRRSSGTIYITKDHEKVLYSLELDDYPESLTLKKHVVFKIDASELSPSRE